MKNICPFAVVAVVAVITCCFCSCEKNDVASDVIVFYGTVVDAKSGEPLWNAIVDAEESKALTGVDGTYELPVAYHGSHADMYVQLKVKASGYSMDTYNHNFGKKEFGKRVKVDFALVRY